MAWRRDTKGRTGFHGRCLMGKRHLVNHLRGTGLVYFLAEPSPKRYREPSGGAARRFVKVGYTTDYRALMLRINDLQIGNPRPLSLLAVVENMNQGAERAVHQAWSKWRVAGEWFFASEIALFRLMESGQVRGVPGLRARPMADPGGA